jgi:DNA-directed RNA polymerase specialized sigma24 family protein
MSVEGNMPVDAQDFRELIKAVLRRDPEATKLFCREYQSHIIRIVRRRLMRRLRSKYDSIDIAQDVWKSFFADPPHHLRFDGPAAVLSYLEEMARRKVVRAVRQRTSAKCNVHLEQPLPQPTAASSGVGLAAPGPTPSEVVGGQEQWEQLVRKQSPRQQRLLNMLLDGLTHDQIARRLRTDVKTVQRLIRRMDRRPLQ